MEQKWKFSIESKNIDRMFYSQEQYQKDCKNCFIYANEHNEIASPVAVSNLSQFFFHLHQTIS